MAAIVVAPKANMFVRNTMVPCLSTSRISTRRNSTGSSPSRASRGKLMIWSRTHVSVFRNFQFFLDVVDRLFLHPCHEIDFLLRQFPKPRVVDVTAVDRQD